ncbi:hypothetical protein BG000_005379, partial [Podila horticola]
MSDDPDIAQWTGHFHDNNGAGRVIKIWNDKLCKGKWEEDFVNSAIDVVASRTLAHLENHHQRTLAVTFLEGDREKG